MFANLFVQGSKTRNKNKKKPRTVVNSGCEQIRNDKALGNGKKKERKRKEHNSNISFAASSRTHKRRQLFSKRIKECITLTHACTCICVSCETIKCYRKRIGRCFIEGVSHIV